MSETKISEKLLSKEEVDKILQSVKTGGHVNLFDYVAFANAVANYVIEKNDKKVQ